MHAVDLSTLCALCPMLQELSAKLSCDLAEEVGQGEIPMLHLKVARIRLASAEVLPALLSCTPALTTLEISYDQDGSTPDLDDKTLEQSVRAMMYANDPPALQVNYMYTRGQYIPTNNGNQRVRVTLKPENCYLPQRVHFGL